MKKIVWLVCMMCGANLMAQQDIQITQNMFNKFSVNPSFAGAENSLNATLLHRSQWVGFEGAPETQILSVELPVYALGGGAGINIYNDQIGDGFTYRQVNGSYAFLGKLGRDATFGLGLSVGIQSVSFDYDLWLAPNGGNGQDDESIPTEDASAIIPDVNLGLHIQKSNYIFGLSSTHVFDFEAELDGGANARFNSSRHVYMFLGAEYELNRDWLIIPSAFMKTDNVEAQWDFNVNFIYDGRLFLGGSYRTYDAVAALLGYQMNENIRFGYSYDITVSDLRTEQSGSHELFVRYSMNLPTPEKGKTRYRNIRFL